MKVEREVSIRIVEELAFRRKMLEMHMGLKSLWKLPSL